MLHDYLFNFSNLAYLGAVVIGFFLTKYAHFLEVNLLSENSDDKLVVKKNKRFQLLLSLFILGLTFAAILRIISLLLFNNTLLQLATLLEHSFVIFLLLVGTIFLDLVFLFSIFTLTLFQHLKPSFKFKYIIKIIKIIATLILISVIITTWAYFLSHYTYLLPKLVIDPVIAENWKWFSYNLSTLVLVIILLFSSLYFKKRFSKTRTNNNARFYAGSGLLFQFVLFILTLSFAVNYFELGLVSPKRLTLFHYSAFFAALAYMFIYISATGSMFFSLFINKNKSEFIVKQFATSFTLKLIRLNSYCETAILIIAIIPFLLNSYYNFFLN